MAPPPLCLLGIRTGSSLATRALALLGLDPGAEDRLMQGKPDDNPKGYWEQEPLVELNDELLAKLGGPWWDMPPLSPGWHESPELDPYRERARALVAELFPNDRQWVWKDPRSSLTLPFWQDVIGPMRYVVCARSPVEVAASLQARDPVVNPWLDATRVYFRLLAEGLRHTDGEARILIFYEDWFHDFDAQLDRLASFALGTAPSATARAEVREFFETTLRHHQSGADEEARLDPEVREGYAVLRDGTDSAGRVAPQVARRVIARWEDLERRLDGDRPDLRARSRAGWVLAQERQVHLMNATRALGFLEGGLRESEQRRSEADGRIAELEAELAERARARAVSPWHVAKRLLARR